ncbi:hypothetical protein Tsubulata_050930 [Turnera subulata]|uniref:RNA polymerase II C-terminal domain phosphatase-like n=1 Tax=Turnera subulata TaxID=218843 RepID=A0A9Q0J4U5_9ROSI|nr:hypothetical protein Tsubulata_050930 [Turnera subulata]
MYITRDLRSQSRPERAQVQLQNMDSDETWASMKDNAVALEAELMDWDPVLEDGNMDDRNPGSSSLEMDCVIAKEENLEAMVCTSTCQHQEDELAAAADPVADSIPDEDSIKEDSEVKFSSGKEQNLETVGSCSHGVILRLLCTTCGKVMNEKYGVGFEYMQEGLRLSLEEAQRWRRAETMKVLGDEKLILVLDLDDTLINTGRADLLTSDEKLLVERVDSGEVSGISLYDLGYKNSFYRTKIRPFVREFLEEASTLFQMYVYTNASKDYGSRIVKLLDPDNKYFNGRVITREASTRIGSKDLDVVLGSERVVVIVDDSPEVWPKHRANLMRIGRYLYFVKAGIHLQPGQKSLAECGKDEPDEGPLFGILKELKKIHREFFKNTGEPSSDVRLIMQNIRGTFLEGCKIQLRDFSPKKYAKLSSKAARLGAVCTTEYDPSITHVVTLNPEPEELQRAEQENKKFMVPEWIDASSRLWPNVSEFPYQHSLKKETGKQSE